MGVAHRGQESAGEPSADRHPPTEAADAILRKMAASGLASLQSDEAAAKPERDRLADEMARRLLQLNLRNAARLRRARDARSAASP